MLYGMMQLQRKIKLENFFKLPNKGNAEKKSDESENNTAENE